ncbi:histidinol-phosphate transaminase [Corynebacterium choanae]|nr:histidinol-phosphate transaminase [Corynebacterium choanae]
MTFTLRDDLGQIPPYVPGKRAPEAVKLSSNEVQLPPLPAAVAAMADAAATANRYPDMSVHELKHELANHLHIDAAQVTCGCGSSALCQQLVQATCRPGEEVIFPWRSFEAYPIFAMVTGATPVPVPLTDSHHVDLVAMAQAITDQTRLIFVCNPNNPTGTTVTKQAFAEFMAAVGSNIVVALDEAYFEYVRDDDTPNAAELLAVYPNLVGLRTFSKAYGLAGVRVGYAFGHAEIIAAVERCALPFGVSGVAQAGALASLAAQHELLARTDVTVRVRDTFQTAVGAVPSQANFVWIPTPDAVDIAAHLAARGVLVRAFPEGIRITVTDEREMDVALQALQAVIEDTGALQQ